MLLMRRVGKQKMHWALLCLTDVYIITSPDNTLKGYSILLSDASVLAQFKVTVNRYLFSVFIFKF